jgi:excinuclease ABC subunit A
VDQGNTVVVIEHNLDVVKSADWLVDLGPEGGAGGGAIVAEGTPEEVAANPDSHTGVVLRKVLPPVRAPRRAPSANGRAPKAPTGRARTAAAKPKARR